VSQKLFNVENVLGFVVFHCSFPMSEGVKFLLITSVLLLKTLPVSVPFGIVFSMLAGLFDITK